MSAEDFWAGAARRLAFRRNAASWCDLYLPLMAALSGAAALALLILRLLGRDERFVWIALGALLAAAGAALAIFVVARRPFTLPEALARLDEVAHLHNRLVSAHAGIGPWPEPRPGVGDAAPWNWPRLWMPVAVAALVLAAVSLVRTPESVLHRRPTEEPAAWSQVDHWLQNIEQAKLADPQAVQKLRDQLNDLRRQSPDDWYKQNSLEAGDALRQQVQQGLREMQNGLEQGSEAVNQAAQQAGQMPSTQLKSLSASLQQAIQGLQTGNLPASGNLLGKLQNFEPGNVGQMTAEQLRQLQQQLKSGLSTCDDCIGPSIQHVPGEAQSRHGGQSGPHGNGQDDGTGSGGPGGGGKTAPLTLDPIATQLNSKNIETDSNRDMRRALPGEVVAVTQSKHQVNQDAPAGPVAGGGIGSAGEGGDAVWHDSPVPEEQQVLQRYFK